MEKNRFTFNMNRLRRALISDNRPGRSTRTPIIHPRHSLLYRNKILNKGQHLYTTTSTTTHWILRSVVIPIIYIPSHQILSSNRPPPTPRFALPACHSRATNKYSIFPGFVHSRRLLVISRLIIILASSLFASGVVVGWGTKHAPSSDAVWKCAYLSKFAAQFPCQMTFENERKLFRRADGRSKWGGRRMEVMLVDVDDKGSYSPCWWWWFETVIIIIIVSIKPSPPPRGSV